MPDSPSTSDVLTAHEQILSMRLGDFVFVILDEDSRRNLPYRASESDTTFWRSIAFLSSVWDGMSWDEIKIKYRLLSDNIPNINIPNITCWWNKGVRAFALREFERPKLSRWGEV